MQKVLEEAATLSPAEWAELAAELSKPIIFTKTDMDRQRKAITELLAIPTFAGPDPKASEDKYAFLGNHDLDV